MGTLTGGRTCAVLGSPIAHSLSPVLHRAAYAALGLDWSYERHEVTEDGLADFVAGCGPEWRGLSLTMPLKFVALEIGEPDEVATLVGAGNTLVFDDPHGSERPGERHVRIHNTDVPGLVSAVRAAGIAHVETAVVLGSGATARSALVSLAGLGCRKATIVARSPEKAADLAPLADLLDLTFEVQPWDGELLPASDLVISTVTSGAADSIAEAVAESAPALFDVLYDPWPTIPAGAATARGSIVLNGLDLLAHQAVGQVRLMTGRDVAAEVLLSAGRAALQGRRSTMGD